MPNGAYNPQCANCDSFRYRKNRVYQDLFIGRPGIQSKAKVVQADTHFHHHITRGVLPEPDRVFDNPQTLDRADDVLNPYSAMGDQAVFRLLRGGEFFTAWLLVRHRDRNTLNGKTDKAQVLQQLTAFG